MKKRLISALLALTMTMSLLAVGASADSSTTTMDTCYKDDSPNTEMYMVTEKAYSDYIYYGAKNEPDCGVYYGRVCSGGTTSTGGWGVANAEELADESAVSFYTSLQDSYTMEYWSYLYGKVTADGEHVLQMNLNFEKEADDCTAVLNGTYDSKLITDFQWLNTLTCPVFLRIACEVNVWTNMPSASTYISAYQHVARLARQYCPNVALVFAPNSSSAYKVDLDSFYPGDDYVDWIGVSLYYNRYFTSTSSSSDAFNGVGTYADAVLKMQQVANLSTLHKKPVIITEGGSARQQLGYDTSEFAANCVSRAYSYLTMVYPQLKCIIYADTNFGATSETANYYSIRDNETVTAAYDKAVANNPTLLHDCSGSASYYTKVSAYTGSWDGTIQLAAYTYTQTKLTANWYIDGAWKATVTDYPYSFSFNADQLSNGTHTVKVLFSNGQYKEYSFKHNRTYTEEELKLVYNRFSDVNEDDWFTPYVQSAIDNGFMNGTSSTTFEPYGATSRAMFVQILYAMADHPSVEGETCPFTDVPENEWYYKAVVWAYNNNVTGGTSATTFGPNEDVTREQEALLLYAYYGRPEVTGELEGFADVGKVSDWAYKALVWATDNGIMSGSKEGSQLYLQPGNSAIRAVTATMMNGFYKLINS